MNLKSLVIPPSLSSSAVHILTGSLYNKLWHNTCPTGDVRDKSELHDTYGTSSARQRTAAHSHVVIQLLCLNHRILHRLDHRGGGDVAKAC